MKLSTIALLFVVILVESAISASQLEFPEKSELDEHKSNLNGRSPLYSPSRCKHHELLYPGDQKDDWICDCAPAAVYYPEADACFLAFRQGPCKANHILVLKRNKIIPECIPNACKTDGWIKIRNQCYKLGESPPCENAHLSYVLGVNPKTLMIDCVKLSINFNTRFNDNEDTEPTYDLETVDMCALGSKRAQQGVCQPTNTTIAASS